MKISIVLSSYNGEKYIVEQLISIRDQLRKADEVLIFDDGSTDRTVDLVQTFIAENNLRNMWRISVNRLNKGCNRNFIEGAVEATGDLIFFSDQDDIWDSEKLALMERCFNEHPKAKACYCQRKFIGINNQELYPQGIRLENSKKSIDLYQKISIEDAYKYNKSPGLCLAMRKELVPKLAVIVAEYGLTHDLPVGLLAALFGEYYVVNKSLVQHRIHGTNLSKPKLTFKDRLQDLKSQIDGTESRKKHFTAVYEKYGSFFGERQYRDIQEAISLLTRCVTAMEHGRVVELFCLLFNRNPMINTWKFASNFCCLVFSKLHKNYFV